jgi:hypothetical protein
MRSVGTSFLVPAQDVTSFSPITIGAATTAMNSACDEAKELFALVAKESKIADQIYKAQRELTQLRQNPISRANAKAIETAETKVGWLLQEKARNNNVSAFREAQGRLTLRLQGLLKDWTIPLSGGEIRYFGTEHPQPQPPVREFLLLVAAYACPDRTTTDCESLDWALNLVKAMASNPQFTRKEWVSDEARAAVRALDGHLGQLVKEPRSTYLKKAIPETASAIITLIQRAKLVSPPTEEGDDTPEMESLRAILNRADGYTRNGAENALIAAEEFLVQRNKNEAVKLLDWAAGLTQVPALLPNGQFTETAAEWSIQQANYVASDSSLLEELYQRDNLAFTKVALAYMEKVLTEQVVVKFGELKIVPVLNLVPRRNYYDGKPMDTLKDETTQLIKVCGADPNSNFLELVRQSPAYVALYTE